MPATLCKGSENGNDDVDAREKKAPEYHKLQDDVSCVKTLPIYYFFFLSLSDSMKHIY
jgi:hypothetical protein